MYSFFLVKIYGAAVTFFEVLSEEQLTEERKKALLLNDDDDDVRGLLIICYYQELNKSKLDLIKIQSTCCIISTIIIIYNPSNFHFQILKVLIIV